LVAGIGGLVIGGLGGFLAAGSVPNPTATSGPARSGGAIKVAGVFPLSGIIASDGKEMANGVRMAVDEINAGGGLLGRTITYVEVDDKDSTTDQISTAFQRATSVEKPDAIFSGYHLATGPEFDIVADAGALYYNVNTPGGVDEALHVESDKVLEHLPDGPDRVLVRHRLCQLGGQCAQVRADPS
jgi:branched-chain amino acid transport system substrate-binding protein